ncbi:MAG: serine/threonine-protein kinase, partial [Candidatus Eiseniibacteriota bacterium]
MKSQRISRYELLEEIGKGGMGVVYRARDEHLGRDVAVKLLHGAGGSDDSTRKRFRQEARALSLLNHPGISTVFDFDSQNGTDFLVMELVDGQSLEDLLRSGPMPETKIIELGAQIAAALAAAHEQGVIHRDLKPGNVRLTPKGQVKLLDFGLALLCPGTAPTVETRSIVDGGHMVGTVPYMSPEQVLGKEVDERSDVYSLGILLYEMATGTRPFQAAVQTALVNEILHRPVPSPGVHGARLSPGLEALIVSMLEKDPKRRPESAARVEAELRGRGGPGAGAASPSSTIAPAPPIAFPSGRIESIVVLPLESLSR